MYKMGPYFECFWRAREHLNMYNTHVAAYTAYIHVYRVSREIRFQVAPPTQILSLWGHTYPTYPTTYNTLT